MPPQPTGPLIAPFAAPMVSTLAVLPGLPVVRMIRGARLLERLQEFAGQLDDPATLRATIQTLVELGDVFGLDKDWTSWLRGVMQSDDSIAALARVFGWLERAGRLFTNRVDDVQVQAAIEPQSFLTWLPVALQLAELLAKLIGSKRLKEAN